jgi:hypothetical protein
MGGLLINRLLAQLATGATAVAIGATIIPAASAKPKSAPTAPATTYQAQIVPLGSQPVTGDAQLVDGPKNDKVSIHMRGLEPRAAYSWHIYRQITCIAAPCDPPLEPGWKYEKLRASAAGNASANGKSKSFTGDPNGTYLVEVQLPGGQVVAQGYFQRVSAPAPPERFQP